jgi:glycosyltransferase involved in cell wall biosynthesis
LVNSATAILLHVGTIAVLRVLVLHNRYRLLGGEERAVSEQVAVLRARGHEVALLERSSSDVSRPTAARGIVLGGIDAASVGAAVRRMRADVVHAHNVHPLFGWRALAAAQEAGARTVLHLHNYRLVCAISVAYRDGDRCYSCCGRNTLPGLRHRCRGSLPEAMSYVIGLSVQQPRLLRHADRLVPVSRALADRLVTLGIPGERMTVLPNFVRSDAIASRSRADAGVHALAAGRIVHEKGFDTAIAAARAAGVPLVVAGEGPDLERLRGLAAGSANVRLTGLLSYEELARVRAQAAVLLVPSRWDEPAPYVALDALAAGVPVLASDRGGLPELVGDEATLPALDVSAWTAALSGLWGDRELRARRGEQAIARVRERFGEDAWYDALMEIYAGR